MSFLKRCVQRSPKIAYRVIDGDALIVETSEGEENKLLILNRVGTIIWESADGKCTVNAIIKKMCEKFEVGQAKARKDADSFIKELIDRGLLVLKPNLTQEVKTDK